MKKIFSTIFIFFSSVSVFAQQANIAEPDTCAHLDEVVVTGVTGSTRIREIAAPVSMISNATLRTHQSTNIIDAISRQPGISQITTGSGISKPVIRGLGYNRVLVVNDGVRQEGQQWGDEHGIELDGNAVHSVEILKGPASLMYGSDAMAGVIIMHDAPVMPLGEMKAEAGTQYQTNNGLFDYSLAFCGHQQGLVWNWRWSQKWAHDYKAPEDGYVPNSRFRERALNGMLGVNKDWGYSHFKLGYYQLTPGMTEIEDEYEEGSRSYAIASPFQQVNHYKAVLDNSFLLGEGYLKTIVGYQQNRRQEFEATAVFTGATECRYGRTKGSKSPLATEVADECGLDFRLHTVNYDLRYVSPEWGGWKMNAGVGGMYQKSDNLGEEFLIPAYNLFDVGVFGTASKTFFERLHMSGGLRYDHRRLHSLALEDEGVDRFSDFKRNFGALSGSLGATLNINEHLDIKANISHGFRAPNMSELGSNGVHEGTFRYELGNHNLKAERSWQFDLGMDYASEHFSASVALFANHISNFIYLSRTGIEIDDTPAYRFTAGDARLLGGEVRLIWHIISHLHFENAISYVDARQLNADEEHRYLPFTPAPRWLSTLHYDIPLRTKILRGLFAEIEADTNFRQNNVMTANNTETPTPGYTLVNLSVGTDIHLRNGRKLCSVGITATNLLNTAYQSHLSRLKYAETSLFTGRQGINNMGRNIGFNLLFPLDL